MRRRELLTYIVIFLAALLSVSCAKGKPHGNATKALEAVPEAEAAPVTTASMLKGDWALADDPRDGLSISDSAFTQTYDGEALQNGSYVIDDAVAKAKTDVTKASGKYVTVFGDGPPSVYYIIDISDDKLSLSYVGRGNTLNYVRTDPSQILRPLIGRDFVYGDWKFSIYEADDSSLQLEFAGSADAGSGLYAIKSSVAKGKGDFVLDLDSDGDASQIEIALEGGTKVRLTALKNFHWGETAKGMVFEPR